MPVRWLALLVSALVSFGVLAHILAPGVPNPLSYGEFETSRNDHLVILIMATLVGVAVVSAELIFGKQLRFAASCTFLIVLTSVFAGFVGGELGGDGLWIFSLAYAFALAFIAFGLVLAIGRGQSSPGDQK